MIRDFNFEFIIKQTMSDKQKFAFDKVNFILLAVGMAIVIIGFLLMTGPSSSETVFEPDIFSARRIKVAPVRFLVDDLCGIAQT